MNRESSLIDGLKKRKESAFRKVYYSYNRLVYFVAYSILKNVEEAEDVTQETFLRLMENIDRYEEKGKLKQYLSSIATSIALDYYRKRRTDQDPFEDDVASEESQEFDVLLTLDMTLEKDEAHIAALHLVYGYTFREIAEEFHVSIGMVQAKYYKAMEKLRKYFKGGNR